MSEEKDENLLYTLDDWYNIHKKLTNKCSNCFKHYKMPNFIFKPRDKICFTCELKLKKTLEKNKFINTFENVGKGISNLINIGNIACLYNSIDKLNFLKKTNKYINNEFYNKAIDDCINLIKNMILEIENIKKGDFD